MNQMSDSPEQRLERLQALQREIDRHPGTRAHRQWEGLATVHAILAVNHQHLVAHLEQVQLDLDVAWELVGNVNVDEQFRQRFHAETYRLLHNFTAAAKSLVDHARNSTKSEPAHLRHEWQKRVDSANADPVVPFINRLRNVILHHVLPPFDVNLQFGSEDAYTADVGLPTESLLGADTWPADARQYMLRQGERVVLLDAVNRYMRAVDGLYTWLFPRLQREHEHDLDAVNVLIGRYNEALSAGRVPLELDPLDRPDVN